MDQGRKRLVGVLGGMGPAATVDFMAKVMAATPAAIDQDHIPLVVYQVPQIPSRTAAVADGSDAPLPAMIEGIRALERAGAEIVAIACNTAHHWHDALARATNLEILHIADAVRDRLGERRALDRRIGLMATRATLQARIFERRLPEIRFVGPSEPTQALVDRAIAAVKAGDIATARRQASAAVRAFRAEGAEVLLLACTELPIALDGTAEAHTPAMLPGAASADWLDATDALARACVAASLGGPAAVAAL